MTASATDPESGSADRLLVATNAPAAPPLPPRSASGWKIGTFVFGAATVVLAILLAGQLASPRYVYDSPPMLQQPSSSSSSTPESDPEAPPISTVSQKVGELGLVIMQNYSTDRGWPAGVTLKNGTATTAEGVVLGEVPQGWTLTYAPAENGGGFSLTLEDSNGESAEFGPAAVGP